MGIKDSQYLQPSSSPTVTPRSWDMSSSLLLPPDIEKALTSKSWAWDRGVFASELIRQRIRQRTRKSTRTTARGTYCGTRAAITEIYNRIEDRYSAFFDVINIEPSIPQGFNLEKNRELYQFQEPGSNNFPPHLNIIPPADIVDHAVIFDEMRLRDTLSVFNSIATMNNDELKSYHDNPMADTISGLEERNQALREKGNNVFGDPNIGDRSDWYSDAVFAQQHFTGPNPTTIEAASPAWILQFRQAADAQENAAMIQLLNAASADHSLYIQDCSHFREVAEAGSDATLISDDGMRFGCATVTLFQLDVDGRLHPLAIVIDYKGTMENSIAVFNKRLNPSDSTASEATDWPWRYAKTCVQVSDFLQHEVVVHLVNTHFVEEVVIVAIHRSFDPSHAMFRLLSPHWLKTLSLNAAARNILVPGVISKIIGLTEEQLYSFTKNAYKRFDWTGMYIPNDLQKRGFPVEEILTNKKFHNYVYGKNIILMWNVLRTFVSSMLAEEYTTDDQVANDPGIASWCAEMRSPSGGGLDSFPIITTVDALIDAVVMCIHIASPQHTAVNYLQQYYQSFVINKPPALCAPQPTSLQTLLGYDEQQLMEALPVGRMAEWLLASHLPYLLSSRVAEKNNLVNYALSVASSAYEENDAPALKAATEFYNQLQELKIVFKRHSNEMDDQKGKYEVMDPDFTAVSILI